MQFTTEQEEEVKIWMMKKLENISDADPGILTEYCLAILKSNSSDNEVRKNAVENLEDFLKDHTVSFVDEVFARYSRKPQPSKAAASSKQSEIITTQTPAPSFVIQPNESVPNTEKKAAARLPPGRKRSYHDANNLRQDAHYGAGTASEPSRPRRAPNGARTTQRRDSSQLPNPLSDMSYTFGNGPPPPTPPPGFPAFDPANPMAAFAFMQTILPQMTAMLPPSPNDRGPAVGSNRSRCQDYDTKGYCVLGSSCPFEHGDDRIIAPHKDEYDPTRANFTLHEARNGALAGKRLVPRSKRGSGRGRTGSVRQDNRAAFSDTRPPSDQVSTSIVVERIPKEYLTEGMVRDFFSQYGKISEITMNLSKHLAVVRYSEHAGAKRAWESPKVVFDNRFVKVYWHRPGIQNGHTSNGHIASAQGATSTVNTTQEDEDAFQQQQDEKQKAYEERMRIRKAMEDARQDIVNRRESMVREREELVRKLAAAEGQDIDGADIRTTPHGDTSRDVDVPDAKIKGLRDQLAQLQSEAKSLGIDPDASSDNSVRSPSSYRRGLGPSAGRGRFQYRGHSFSTSHHYAPRFMRGRDSSVRKLDNRPKNIVISGVDFDSAKEESLRSYLTLLGPFESLEPNPEREDSRIVIFKERWQAEQVMRGRRDIQGVGKVEASWADSRHGNGPAAEPVAGTTEDLVSGEIREDGTKALSDDLHQHQPLQDADFDVAGGDDDDWGAIT